MDATNKTVKLKTRHSDGHCSAVLKKSVLFKYVRTDADGISDRHKAFDKACDAFKKEATAALTVVRSGLEDSAERFELMRPFIIKVLLYIGIDPDDRVFGILARVLELKARYAEMDINDVISYIASVKDILRTAVNRAVEKSINYYDSDIMDRISFLTDTQPKSARDAICDLAIYVRIKHLGRIQNA